MLPMTMAAEAEVTELGNAPIEPEATPQEPVFEAPETEAAVVEETEAAPQEPTPAPVDPLADLDDETLLAHPRVRDRLRREGESLRQRTERETETRIQAARQNWVASGQAFADIQGALDQGNPQQAQAYIEAALNNRDWAAVSTVDRIGRSKLPEGKIAVEDQNRLDEALWAVQQGRGTLEGYVDTLIEVRAKAYAENTLQPQIEARIAREQAAKQRQAAKVAGVQQAEAINGSRPGPTLGVPGLAGGKVMLTTAELDAINTNVWRELPAETRERLRGESREADRLYGTRVDPNIIKAVIGR